MVLYRIPSALLCVATALFSTFAVRAEDCELMMPDEPLTQSLAGLSSVSFVGVKPSITRFASDEPMLKVIRWSSQPSFSVEGGKMVVSTGSCTAGDTGSSTMLPVPEETEAPVVSETDAPATEANADPAVEETDAPVAEPSAEDETDAPVTADSGDPDTVEDEVSGGTGISAFYPLAFSSVVTGIVAGWMPGLALFAAASLPMAHSQVSGSCDEVLEVEIYGPAKSVGALHMEEQILWEHYDDAEESLHWTPDASSWAERVNSSRLFRNSDSGDLYNYRNKVLMGLSQTRIIHEPPETTPKEDVVFDIPEGVIRPDTDEGVMMLSVLEMAALLQQGDITAVQLCEIAIAMAQMYDPDFNIVEVPAYELAMAKAAEADALFANGTVLSPIQGIPFAIKDTFDLGGHATAYGSWEFLDNIREEESPLITYAMQYGAVPLFKSSVPQLTWGRANFNGTTYSCLNGGYSSGVGTSGGSSIGSGAAVCLGVVPVAICEQTGSSCQAPAFANGISTIIPALGTFSRENNGLYSFESDRPGLHCRDIMSCAVFYNYMRGASYGDPQSRDVPFSNPAAEDLSTYTIAFVDNSDSQQRLEFDTPFKGERGNVLEALEASGATVRVEANMSDLIVPNQLWQDYMDSGIRDTVGYDWYWLNMEGFFEDVFKYGASREHGSESYGPVWVGQNYNFDAGSHRGHVGATALGYLDSLFLHAYVSEYAMYPMLEQLPDVVVHFGQSELDKKWYNDDLIKRAGINTVHIPEFYWNVTDSTFVAWRERHDLELRAYEKDSTLSAAMITCESKKYEPVKALAVCNYLQNTLVPGGKLISPQIDTIQDAIASGRHDLDCPYNWEWKRPGYLDDYPEYLRERVLSKLGNIGNVPNCPTQEDDPSIVAIGRSA